MITCFIRYELDPYKLPAFDEYARNWGQAIPRCGAELIGYFAPHEGSATTAYQPVEKLRFQPHGSGLTLMTNAAD
jgi:NIPSNAP